jgi:hypothetical protein
MKVLLFLRDVVQGAAALIAGMIVGLVVSGLILRLLEMV